MQRFLGKRKRGEPKMKTRYEDKEICLKCQKPLIATICMACGGRCYHRHLLISKHFCARCMGTGKEYRCPNQFSHYEDEGIVRKQRMVDEYIRSYGQSATKQFGVWGGGRDNLANIATICHFSYSLFLEWDLFQPHEFTYHFLKVNHGIVHLA